MNRELIVERIHRMGPIGFDEYVDLALYGKAGFYASGRGAGKRADFLTSPEVGPLFGAVIARALDRWWRDMGEPDPFFVIEGGAGRGALARSVLDAQPTCRAALRYVLVDRAGPPTEVALDPPHLAFGPSEGDGDERRPVPGTGPVVVALAELPAVAVDGVVIANELLDNLAFGLLERTSDGWLEVRVGVGADGDGDQLVEVLVPVDHDGDAPTGARIPVQHQAADWVRDARAVLERGRVVVIDYADTTASMARRPWHEWVRTYRAHGRGGHPLDDPGAQDVTCEVAVDQLPPPDLVRDQAAFLREHGIGELAEEARAAWQARAHIGDLEALKHRSRVGEAAALTDPTGLGAFRVLEWVVHD